MIGNRIRAGFNQLAKRAIRLLVSSRDVMNDSQLLQAKTPFSRFEAIALEYRARPSSPASALAPVETTLPRRSNPSP